MVICHVYIYAFASWPAGTIPAINLVFIHYYCMLYTGTGKKVATIMQRVLFLSIFLFFFCFRGVAQKLPVNQEMGELNNLRTKTFSTLPDTVLLDSLSIIPGSIIIHDLTHDIVFGY